MTILLFIKRYWKPISIILAVLSVVTLLWTIDTLRDKLREQTLNYERMEDNLYHSNYALTSYKDKLGKVVYQNQALLLSKDELKRYNTTLIDEIENLKLKLKNVQSVSNIQYVYDICIDTVPVLYEKSWYYINYQDSFVTFRCDLNTDRNTLENTKIKVTDSLTLVWTYETKGWWIFKRKTGLKLVFKNTNKYLEMQGMQNYYIIDFKNKYNK